MDGQSSSSEVLHSLPVELVRIIFEDAACHSRRSATNLACVSKKVHKWIIPILYQTVILERPYSLVLFHQTIVVAKSEFGSYTRALYVLSPPCPGVPPDFLAHFPSLQHLVISSLSLREPPSPSILQRNICRPTSITIIGSLSRISFRHPIFQSCTHLYFADGVPSPFALTTDVLPCLTHLACAYRHGTTSSTAVTSLPLLLTEGRTGQSFFFSDSQLTGTPVRMTPVNPRVLIVDLYLSNGSPDATMFVMELLGLGKSPLGRERRTDPRFLTRPGEPLTPQRWLDYVVSGVMWTTAEEEIRLA